MPEDVRCPICGSEMVVRTVKKGPNVGSSFYVCTRYPDCKGKVPIWKQTNAEKTSEGGKMFCSNCGVQLPDDSRFCSECGVAIQAISEKQDFHRTTATRARVHYAGFWRRVGAYFIDGLIMSPVSWGISFLAIVIGASVAEDEDLGAGIGLLIGAILLIVLAWIYFAAMESSSKQATLGKMALGIIVTDLKGHRISFGKATGRHFGKIVSGIILYIGFIMVAFTEKKQGLHDMMAGCLVVVKR